MNFKYIVKLKKKICSFILKQLFVHLGDYFHICILMSTITQFNLACTTLCELTLTSKVVLASTKTLISEALSCKSSPITC